MDIGSWQILTLDLSLPESGRLRSKSGFATPTPTQPPVRPTLHHAPPRPLPPSFAEGMDASPPPQIPIRRVGGFNVLSARPPPALPPNAPTPSQRECGSGASAGRRQQGPCTQVPAGDCTSGAEGAGELAPIRFHPAPPAYCRPPFGPRGPGTMSRFQTVLPQTPRVHPFKILKGLTGCGEYG